MELYDATDAGELSVGLLVRQASNPPASQPLT